MKHVGFIAGLIALCATGLFSQSSDLDLYAQGLLSCSSAAPIDPIVPFAYQDIGVEQTCRELKKIKSASGLKRFLLTAPRFNAVMYGPFAPDLHEKIGRDIAEVKNRLAGSGIEVGWWCAPSIRYFSNFPSIEDWQGNTSKDNKKCPLDEAFIADFASHFMIFFSLFGACSAGVIIEDNPRSSLLSSGGGVRHPCQRRYARRKDMGNNPPERCS